MKKTELQKRKADIGFEVFKHTRSRGGGVSSWYNNRGRLDITLDEGAIIRK